MDVQEIRLKDIASDEKVFIATLSDNVYRLSYEEGIMSLRSGRISKDVTPMSQADIEAGVFKVGRTISWETRRSTPILRIVRLGPGQLDRAADRFAKLQAAVSPLT